jgi:hypothetical protein
LDELSLPTQRVLNYRVEIVELRTPAKDFSDARSISDKRRRISGSAWTNANGEMDPSHAPPEEITSNTEEPRP